MGGVERLEAGQRPLLVPFAAFAAGVWLAPHGPAATWIILGATAFGLAAWLRRRRAARVIVAIGFGAAGMAISTLHRAGEVPFLAPNTRTVFEGVVETAEPTRSGHRLVLNTRVRGIASRVSFSSEPAPPGVLPGQRVALVGTARELVAPQNPGERNSTEAARRRGVSHSGHFDPTTVVALSAPHGWERPLAELRARVQRLAEKTNGGDAAAVYAALAVGARERISADMETAYAQSGLAHILSVSGVHVALLGLCVYGALRWLWLRVPHRRTRRIDARAVAGFAALPVVVAYVLLTGAEAPAVRSGLMVAAAFLAPAFMRRADGLNTLVLAGLVMLAFSPGALFSLSFQLSFLAVAALVLAQPSFARWLPRTVAPASQTRWERWWDDSRRAVVGTVLAGLAVTLVTFPLLANAFNRVSVIGPLANAVALPLCFLVVATSAAGCALAALSPVLADPAVQLGVWLCRGLNRTAEVAAAFPRAFVSIPPLPAWAMALWWLGVAAWFLGRGQARWAGVVALLAFAAWLPQRDAPGLEVTFLSVGHGDAVVLSSRGHHAIVDGGGVPRGHVGRRVVAPFLREKGIASFDLAVLTHAHPDHALGLAEALSEIPASRLWFSAGSGYGPLVDGVVRASPEASVEQVAEGWPRFRLGDATIEVLSPPRDRILLKGENDRSIVLRVSMGRRSFLLLGDVEEAGEERLPLAPVDVVKVAHHGSRTSSTPRLVQATNPGWAVFSVGRDNRFHLPHDEVTARWCTGTATTCLRTDELGAITFRTDGEALELATFDPPPGR